MVQCAVLTLCPQNEILGMSLAKAPAEDIWIFTVDHH